MSNLIEFATPRKQTRNQHLETWLADGSIDIMDGTRRASPQDSITTQNVIATFDLAATPGTSTDGVFTGVLPDDAMILVSGTPTWAIVKDSVGVVVFDCAVGGDGSGNVIELISTALIQGGLLTMTQFQLSEA